MSTSNDEVRSDQPEPFTCAYCGASTSKKTGRPFTHNGLTAHLKACPRRSSPAGNPAGILPQDPAAGKRAGILPQEVNRTNDILRNPAAGNLPSLSFPRKEEEAAACREEGESVAALWTRYKHLVKPRLHAFMAMKWKFMTEPQRNVRLGIEAELRAYAEEDAREKAESEAERESEREFMERAEHPTVAFRMDYELGRVVPHPDHVRENCRICSREDAEQEERDRQLREFRAKAVAEWEAGLARITARLEDLRRRVDESIVSRDWSWVAELSELDQLDVAGIIERRLEADARYNSDVEAFTQMIEAEATEPEVELPIVGETRRAEKEK